MGPPMIEYPSQFVQSFGVPGGNQAIPPPWPTQGTQQDPWSNYGGYGNGLKSLSVGGATTAGISRGQRGGIIGGINGLSQGSRGEGDKWEEGRQEGEQVYMKTREGDDWQKVKKGARWNQDGARWKRDARVEIENDRKNAFGAIAEDERVRE